MKKVYIPVKIDAFAEVEIHSDVCKENEQDIAIDQFVENPRESVIVLCEGCKKEERGLCDPKDAEIVY